MSQPEYRWRQFTPKPRQELLDDGATLALAAGSEVDVVLEQPDGSVAGVEVKASASAAAWHFAALQALRDQLGRKFVAGAVLYTGDQVIPYGDKLWLMPLAA